MYAVERSGMLSKRGATSLFCFLSTNAIILVLALGLSTVTLIASLGIVMLQYFLGLALRHRCIRVDLYERAIYVSSVCRTMPFIQWSTAVNLRRVSLELVEEDGAYLLELTNWLDRSANNQHQGCSPDGSPFRYIVTEVGTENARELALQHLKHVLDLVSFLREDTSKQSADPPGAVVDVEGAEQIPTRRSSKRARTALAAEESERHVLLKPSFLSTDLRPDRIGEPRSKEEEKSRMSKVAELEGDQIIVADYENDVVIFKPFEQKVPIDRYDIPVTAIRGGSYSAPFCICFANFEFCTEGLFYGICQNYRQNHALETGLQDPDPHTCDACLAAICIIFCSPCISQCMIRVALRKKLLEDTQPNFIRECLSPLVCFCCSVMQTHQELTQRNYSIGGLMLPRRLANGHILADTPSAPQNSTCLKFMRLARMVVAIAAMFLALVGTYVQPVYTQCIDAGTRQIFSVALFNTDTVSRFTTNCGISNLHVVAMHTLAVLLILGSFASLCGAAVPVLNYYVLVNAKGVGAVGAILAGLSSFSYFMTVTSGFFGQHCNCQLGSIALGTFGSMLLNIVSAILHVAMPADFQPEDIERISAFTPSASRPEVSLQRSSVAPPPVSTIH